MTQNKLPKQSTKTKMFDKTSDRLIYVQHEFENLKQNEYTVHELLRFIMTNTLHYLILIQQFLPFLPQTKNKNSWFLMHADIFS